jgi:uncharacterized protein YndB with AHSA1/START domain
MSTPTKTQIQIKRSFQSPRSLVWRAFSEPELVKQWLTGPEGHTMPECEIDFRVGGRWRYVWLIPVDRMVAYGTFKTIMPETRIVHTESFEMFPGPETVVETNFVELGDGTLVTMTINCDSEETRNAILQSGMDQGLETSYRNLDALLLTEKSFA